MDIKMVCFKQPETIDGRQLFGNDLMPAIIEPYYKAKEKRKGYENTVDVIWLNGMSCVISKEQLSIEDLPEEVDIEYV